jgi:hypothetical protein
MEEEIIFLGVETLLEGLNSKNTYPCVIKCFSYFTENTISLTSE